MSPDSPDFQTKTIQKPNQSANQVSIGPVQYFFGYNFDLKKKFARDILKMCNECLKQSNKPSQVLLLISNIFSRV